MAIKIGDKYKIKKCFWDDMYFDPKDFGETNASLKRKKKSIWEIVSIPDNPIINDESMFGLQCGELTMGFMFSEIEPYIEKKEADKRQMSII